MEQPENVRILGGGPELAADLYLPPHARGPVPGVVTGATRKSGP